MAKKLIYLSLPLLFAALLAGLGRMSEPEKPDPHIIQGYERWSEEALAAASDIPIQSGGRMMPLGSFARFALYRISSRKSVPIYRENLADPDNPEKLKLSPLEWMLDSLLRPQYARQMPVILVDNPEIFTTLGLEETLPNKRDRYSLMDLRPGFEALDDAYAPLSDLEAAELDATQKEITSLYGKVAEVNALSNTLSWTTAVPIRRTSLFATGLDLPKQSVLDIALDPSVIDNGLTPGQEAPIRQFTEELEAEFQMQSSSYPRFTVIPPSLLRADSAPVIEGSEEVWWHPGEVLRELRRGSELKRSESAALLSQLEVWGQSARASEIAAASGQAYDLNATLTPLFEEWKQTTKSTLDKRTQSKLKSEVSYYNIKLLGWAQLGFWLILVLVIVQMFFSHKPAFAALAQPLRLAGIIPILLLAAAIAWRCFLRDRPPVTNLYDTFLFVSGVAALIAWVTELLTRRQLALLLSAVIGVLGLVCAMRFEVGMGTDTKQPEIAVLDTQYWLIIHVLTISVGYSAAVLAAATAMGWLLVRAVEGPKHPDLKLLGTMAYAVTCFGALFATVGTILGGVWANDSWGRFWGWDPKENGALMIVLCQLAILHGRLGGILKPIMLNCFIVLTGGVTLFSWFHVNLLGIGLHSYGFSQSAGLKLGLNIGYGLVALFIALGLAIYFFDPRGKRKPHQRLKQGQTPNSAPSSKSPAN